MKINEVLKLAQNSDYIARRGWGNKSFRVRVSSGRLYKPNGGLADSGDGSLSVESLLADDWEVLEKSPGIPPENTVLTDGKDTFVVVGGVKYIRSSSTVMEDITIVLV